MTSRDVSPVSEAFAISTTFSPREIQFMYSGAITESGIKTLTDNVDTGFGLYQPDRVTVHMKSPGGQMSALEYWVYRLNRWQAMGRRIATQADTECASAAAMIVSLGNVGRRSAHPLSKLLFHNPRLVSRDITLLEQDAEEAALVLKESRARMHKLLEEHLAASLGLLRFARTLRSRAEWLLDDAHSIQAGHLRRYAPRAYALEDLMGSLTSWATMRLADQDDASVLIAQWTAQIDTLFRKDQLIDLRAAWALLLIDETDVLPPIIEEEVSCEEEKEKWTDPAQQPGHQLLAPSVFA